MNVKAGLVWVAALATVTFVIYNRDNKEDVWSKLTDIVQQSSETGDANAPTGPIPLEAITNGMAEAEFKSVFGEPKGSIATGKSETLQYKDFRVTLTNGTIINLPENISAIYVIHNKPSALEKIKELPKQIPAPKELKSALAKKKSFKVLDSKNDPVDHTSLVSSGTVTVVEFYSPDLEACQLVDEGLEKLLAEYDHVELRKIQIDSWNSEIARQYHINSVPDIRILDQYGYLVSQPITRIEKIDGQLDLSRVAEAVDAARKH